MMTCRCTGAVQWIHLDELFAHARLCIVERFETLLVYLLQDTWNSPHKIPNHVRLPRGKNGQGMKRKEKSILMGCISISNIRALRLCSGGYWASLMDGCPSWHMMMYLAVARGNVCRRASAMVRPLQDVFRLSPVRRDLCIIHRSRHEYPPCHLPSLFTGQTVDRNLLGGGNGSPVEDREDVDVPGRSCCMGKRSIRRPRSERSGVPLGYLLHEDSACLSQQAVRTLQASSVSPSISIQNPSSWHEVKMFFTYMSPSNAAW